MTAAAFWINPNCFDQLPPELDDSKKLNPAKRALIFAALTGGEHLFNVVSIAAAGEFDRIGINSATFLAMRQAATKLQAVLISRWNAISLCLVDGNVIADLHAIKTVIKGDTVSCSIAAASIIAKETRDNLMRNLARDVTVYGWDSNMGYGTKSHSDALQAHGISEHHRRSFAPIKRLLQS